MSAQPYPQPGTAPRRHPETTDAVTHAACPECNAPEAPFVVTLCGIAQDPSEQVPPIGPFCQPCQLEATNHPCFLVTDR